MAGLQKRCMVARTEKTALQFILALSFILSTCSISMAGQWIRIPIEKSGIYYLYALDLQQTGVNINTIDPATFRLFNQGKEVAINLNSKGSAFGITDYIEFYAEAIAKDSRQSEFTKENIYWLTWGGDQGKRMTIKDGYPGGLSPSPYFIKSIHLEQDFVLGQQIPVGNEDDYWFWERLSNSDPYNIFQYTFPIYHLYTNSYSCALRYELYGRTDDPVISLDHHTRVYVNGYLIDDHEWDGIRELNQVVSAMPCSYLKEGYNTLKIESVDTGAEVNSLYLNWIELDYPATYTADNNRLTFSVEGNGPVDISVTNFTISDAVTIFDITDPLNISKIGNFKILPDGKTVKFRDTIIGTRTYLSQSVTDTTPLLLIDTPSSLKSPFNGADYIIIAHKDFYDSIKPLANYRSGQGYRVIVASVEDIYDEFSYGIFDPQAIKDFLKYAYEEWKQPAPKYVLLVGDANLDFKDNWDTGEHNFVPTYLYKSEDYGLIPSDNWFVSFDSSNPSPQIAIGRLPVKTSDEATSIVNKIIKYESDPEAEWHKNLLFVADDADSGETEFETLLETLADQYVPPSYNLKKVYLGEYQSEDTARDDVASGIRDGSLITVYSGHGDIDQWGDERLFYSPLVTEDYLKNYDRPTFVITLNCLNGFFAMPGEGSDLADIPLAEALLKVKSNAGALAAWSPTGLGYTWEHSLLAETLFDIMFNEGEATLGKAIIKAKGVAYGDKGVSRDIVEMYTLFGDPATRLKKVASAKTGGSGGGGGGGCFIATAAYGSALHPHLKYLRDFRDTYLLTNGSGREFVRLYYTYSPPMAEYIKERPFLRMVIRIWLLPLVAIAWAATTLSFVHGVVAASLCTGLAVVSISLLRRIKN